MHFTWLPDACLTNKLYLLHEHTTTTTNQTNKSLFSTWYTNQTWMHRRSMGLPPVQGHNNIRLTNTGNLYQNHNFRLDTTTQLNTIKNRTTQHKYHLSMNPHPIIHRSRPLLSSKRVSSVPMPASILKPTRYQPLHGRIVENRTQFERTQRQMPRPYPHSLSYPYPQIQRNVLPTSYDNNYRTNRSKKVRLQIPLLSVVPTRERRASRRHCTRKHSIISNMPLINVNSSVLMVNHSPLGLRDPRFGIFHHCSQSISYL